MLAKKRLAAVAQPVTEVALDERALRGAHASRVAVDAGDRGLGDPPDAAVDVTLLMPCLNEAGTLPQCIARAREALDALRAEQGLSGEILVSDNGSTDGSAELAQRLGARVVHCSQRGYGAALRAGALAARGRYIAMADADASYDFLDAVPMIDQLARGAELCMGSRFAGEILPGAMPWKNRYIGNPVLTGVLNLLFRSGFSDVHCGLRAFTRDAFARINPTSTGMEYASEMVIKARLLGCRCAEVPVVLRPDGRGRPPHLNPLRDGWRHLRYIIMLSPVELYLIPGAAGLCLGVTLFGLLLAGAPGEVVRIGPLWFGDHWMPVAMGLVVCGFLSVLFAMAAALVGIRGGYRRATPLLAGLYRCARLETLLTTSAVCLLSGAVMVAEVVLTWTGHGFGPLSMERQMLAGITASIIGVEAFFGGFLLSIVAGNEADVRRAATTEGAERSSSGAQARRGGSDGE